LRSDITRNNRQR